MESCLRFSALYRFWEKRISIWNCDPFCRTHSQHSSGSWRFGPVIKYWGFFWKMNVGCFTAMLLNHMNNTLVYPSILWHDVQIIGMRRWLMLQWTLSSASEKLHTLGNITHALNMNRYWERRVLCNIKTCGWIRSEVLNRRIVQWIR